MRLKFSAPIFRSRFFPRLLPVSIFAFLAIVTVCCGKKEVSHDHDAARLLFEKSVRMISVYIDSIQNASDSASLQRVVNNFNTKITTLNFEFPSNTDLELNEDENDSLIKLHKRLAITIHTRDSVLSHPSDSLKSVVAQDSINPGGVANKSANARVVTKQ